jgi:hypothetical protein
MFEIWGFLLEGGHRIHLSAFNRLSIISTEETHIEGSQISQECIEKSNRDGDRTLERLYDQQNTRCKYFRYPPTRQRTQVETQRIGVIGESAKVGLEFDD